MDIAGNHWTTTELRRQGLSEHQITRLCRDGILHRLAQGIYTRGAPEGLGLLKALYHRYPALTFTGHSALSVYGGRDHVLRPATGAVPQGHRIPKGTHLLARRTRRRDSTLVNGLPVVNPRLLWPATRGWTGFCG